MSWFLGASAPDPRPGRPCAPPIAWAAGWCPRPRTPFRYAPRLEHNPRRVRAPLVGSARFLESSGDDGHDQRQMTVPRRRSTLRRGRFASRASPSAAGQAFDVELLEELATRVEPRQRRRRVPWSRARGGARRARRACATLAARRRSSWRAAPRVGTSAWKPAGAPPAQLRPQARAGAPGPGLASATVRGATASSRRGVCLSVPAYA